MEENIASDDFPESDDCQRMLPDLVTNDNPSLRDEYRRCDAVIQDIWKNDDFPESVDDNIWKIGDYYQGSDDDIWNCDARQESDDTCKSDDFQGSDEIQMTCPTCDVYQMS